MKRFKILFGLCSLATAVTCGALLSNKQTNHIAVSATKNETIVDDWEILFNSTDDYNQGSSTYYGNAKYVEDGLQFTIRDVPSDSSKIDYWGVQLKRSISQLESSSADDYECVLSIKTTKEGEVKFDGYCQNTIEETSLVQTVTVEDDFQNRIVKFHYDRSSNDRNAFEINLGKFPAGSIVTIHSLVLTGYAEEGLSFKSEFSNKTNRNHDIFAKMSGWYLNDSAWFAAYAYGDGVPAVWFRLFGLDNYNGNLVTGNVFPLSENYTSIIFTRMKAGAYKLSWSNKDNQVELSNQLSEKLYGDNNCINIYGPDGSGESVSYSNYKVILTDYSVTPSVDVNLVPNYLKNRFETADDVTLHIGHNYKIHSTVVGHWYGYTELENNIPVKDNYNLCAAASDNNIYCETGAKYHFEVKENGKVYARYNENDVDTIVEEYATYFLAATSDACAALNVTEALWQDLRLKGIRTPSAVKETFGNAIGNQSGTVVEQAMARYDFIVVKYNESLGTTPDFFVRFPSGIANASFISETFAASDYAEDSCLLIFTGLFSSLSLVGLVMIKRKKAL